MVGVIEHFTHPSTFDHVTKCTSNEHCDVIRRLLDERAKLKCEIDHAEDHLIRLGSVRQLCTDNPDSAERVLPEGDEGVCVLVNEMVVFARELLDFSKDMEDVKSLRGSSIEILEEDISIVKNVTEGFKGIFVSVQSAYTGS